MIWEQNTRIIVMMTRLEERSRIKCDQYWPTRGTDTYPLLPNSNIQYPINKGHPNHLQHPLDEGKTKHSVGQQPGLRPQHDCLALTVTLVDSVNYAYYTMRTFHLQKMGLAGTVDRRTGGLANGCQLRSCSVKQQQGYDNYHRQSKHSDLQTESCQLNGVSPRIMDTLHGGPDGLVSVSEVREIRHFQFTAWPDNGAPDQSQPLLLFIRRINQTRMTMKQQLIQRHKRNGVMLSGCPFNACSKVEIGPTVVHCSAGVGRTGAFIVIDSQLERLKHEQSVDVFGAVSRMRSQRNFMVQTEEQYAFLYDVLVEAVETIDTEVLASGLYQHLMKLRQPASNTLLAQYLGIDNRREPGHLNSNMSGLELEYKRLSLNLRITGQFSSANLAENQGKNLMSELLPYEANRVCLSPIRGIPGSDYINASYIDGYYRRRAYIATQAPLPSTVNDFWRMLWEHNSPIVVMLCRLREADQEVCYQYWPNDRSAHYHQLIVEPMVEYNMPSFVLREFRLTDARDGQTRTLRQFQLTDWPDQTSVPRSAEALIELIGQVHKTQAQFGQDGPITVHCTNGVGRTGVFLALTLLLERMRCESMVDVFLTTRMLRTERPQMVQTGDQYGFCYVATLEYLASFDNYPS